MADGDIVVDVNGLHVFIGLVVNRDFPPQLCEALLNTVALLNASGVTVSTQNCTNGAYVDVGRCAVAHKFLASTCDLILMIDSDMYWTANSALRIVAATKELGCVVGTYVMRKDDVLFTLTGLEPGKPISKNELGLYTWSGLGAGLGFTCVTRKIMQELSDAAPLVHFGASEASLMKMIFRTGPVATERAKALGAEHEWFGEDINFFNDIERLGYKIWLDPEIRLGHIGSKCYTASIKDYLAKVTNQ